jgi:hypothetical protein
MNRLADKWPPTRTDASITVGCIALILSLVVAITNGVLAGLTLFLGFSGVLSLTWLLIPARPRLVATLRGRENASQSVDPLVLVVGGDREIRPLDIDAIVEAEEKGAQETMPRSPTPRVPPGLLGGAFELNAGVADTLASISGVSDDELRDFLGDVSSYGNKLRTWLEELDAARAEQLREFSLVARAEELGQTSADFVRLRLSFPSAFEEQQRSGGVPSPPTRPSYVGRFDLIGARVRPPLAVRRGSLAHLIPNADVIRGISAEYSAEDGAIVVDLNIGHINQNEHRDTAEFFLRAGPVGRHEVKWRISANGLDQPAEGTLTVEVKEPRAADPICDLSDALAEREQYRLD